MESARTGPEWLRGSRGDSTGQLRMAIGRKTELRLRANKSHSQSHRMAWIDTAFKQIVVKGRRVVRIEFCTF